MLEHGVDPNVEGKFQSRLLHFLMAAGITSGKPVMTEAERLQFAETLVRHGAALDPRDALLQSTPLGWACRWGRREVAGFLLKSGAATMEPDAEPWATPLAWAEKRGHQDIAAMLRSHGALD
jgi:ankyrin repeat protein